MQLGNWVEFETIVVKEQTANGSKPATRTLRRTRRGMVIGARSVYDVTSGTPPLLTNRQTVLLVAVSLHRAYRVFPTDTRPTTPPQPRRRRNAPQPQAVVSGPATINLNGIGILSGINSGGNGMARTQLSQNDLEVLVADQINQQTGAGTTFTAYDITQALRIANPGLEILHDAVRRAVHNQMQAIVASSIYDREDVPFGSQVATRYSPV